MAKISVYIIAYNEEHKIADAVKSVLWADEVIVADSNSVDNTAKIAATLGAKVIQIPFKGFGQLRNDAIAQCQHDWILSIDADERCTELAKAEILEIINSRTQCDIFYLPRKNYFMGRWIKHVWPYPNYRQPQLFRKGALEYKTEVVHEGFIAHSERPIGFLKNAIWQIPFRNLQEIFYKADRYSTLSAGQLYQTGKRSGIGKAILHGLWGFIKNYFVKRGFMDGWPGFVIAFSNAEGAFYRYAKLLELYRQTSNEATIT